MRYIFSRPSFGRPLVRFPYLLPNLVGAGLALCSTPLAFLFLSETLPVIEAAGGEL